MHHQILQLVSDYDCLLLTAEQVVYSGFRETENQLEEKEWSKMSYAVKPWAVKPNQLTKKQLKSSVELRESRVADNYLYEGALPNDNDLNSVNVTV